jgi:hypothetical protein
MSGARSPWRQSFFTVARSNCGSSVWNLLHVALLARTVCEVARRFLGSLCIPGLRETTWKT